MNELMILQEAERRWLYDAGHHARVEMAAQNVNFGMRERGGRDLSDEEWSLTRHAASVALVVAGLDPTTGEPL